MKSLVFAIFILSFLLFFTGIAKAGAEVQINEMLEQGGNVHLDSGVYEIEGPIYIGSNTVLTGEKDTIIRVSASSSQWFTGMTGLICSSGPVDNVVIQGFQIDGNLDQLPRSYADHAGGDHNAQRAIIINGQTTRFSTNITIRDMEIYDCYSDAIHVRMASNVISSNNFVSNCQHSGIYYVSVIDGIMKNNEVAGICSDNIRLDNCVNNIVSDNVLYSYTGDNSNGQYQKGQNGIQIANQGFSHNGGSEKPTKTENIEVFGNLFADTGLRTIWLDSTGKGVKNVFIHDNEFAESEPFETSGEPVKIHDNQFVDIPQIEINGKPVSIDNLPSKELSHKVFNSIFDVFNLEYTESAYVKQGDLSPLSQDWETKGKAEAYIYLAGYEGQITIGNETYIPKAPFECAEVLTGTKNLASRPVDQESELKLTDGANNGLHVELEVKTTYKVKSKKTITILGHSFKVNDYKEKSKTATFEKDFPAPAVFPAATKEDLNISVRHYNNTYNPHTIVEISPKNGTKNVFQNVVYKYEEGTAKDTRLLGHVQIQDNGFKTVNYHTSKHWESNTENLTYVFQGCYIKGYFDPSLLTVDVFTPYDKITLTDSDFEVTEIGDPTLIFNRGHLVILFALLILGMGALSMLRNCYLALGRLR